MYEVIVVGGGPAGLSAALALAHFRRSVVLFDAGEQRNQVSHAVHNYLGLDGISPRELLDRGCDEARRAGADLRRGRVTGIRRDGDHFKATLEGQPPVAAARVVLATSLVDVKPDVDNLESFYGTTVHHCPICDAASCADRPVVAISWGTKAVGFALELHHWTKRLTLLTHDHQLEEDQRTRLERYGITVRNERVLRLVGRGGQVTHAVLAGDAIVTCDAVFFSVAHRPRNELAMSLGCELEGEGYVKVDAKYETTVPNVYAAGDITAREESVIDAVAEGFIAACNIHTSLYPEL